MMEPERFSDTSAKKYNILGSIPKTSRNNVLSLSDSNIGLEPSRYTEQAIGTSTNTQHPQ